MMNQDVIGVVAALIGIYAFFPYLRDIFRGKTHPHIFTWTVWTLLMLIGFTAQITEGAGPGAWATGAFGLLNLSVVILALKYGEKSITRSDWIMLSLSLLAIPLWILTKSPLWSVILISVIDVIAFLPTFRKSWTKPHEETLETYLLVSLSVLLSFAALHAVTLTTVLYPATLLGVNLVFVTLALIRRKQMGVAAEL